MDEFQFKVWRACRDFNVQNAYAKLLTSPSFLWRERQPAAAATTTTTTTVFDIPDILSCSVSPFGTQQSVDKVLWRISKSDRVWIKRESQNDIGINEVKESQEQTFLSSEPDYGGPIRKVAGFENLRLLGQVQMGKEKSEGVIDFAYTTIRMGLRNWTALPE
ncbi:hypothetical protein PV328_008602 [Microctonus aethiopoides]|uniref:Uncharacterized protein n=1 Tax=Microctonus aethiopoides TaxID=144406 RepID=A0AA39FJL1_9HYME|nr:hypothetical protein PV328_008602 [Microctonus aethiopoides]